MKTKRPNRKGLIQSAVTGHPFFAGMKPKHLNALAELACEVKFQPDQVILREGQPATGFFLLLEGDVALDAHSPGSVNALIQSLHAGDALGWSWMFKPYVWQFDARALGPVRALKFNTRKLRAQCEDKPRLGLEIYRRIAEVMMKRLQASRLQMLDWYGDNR
mgnify:CR=1 FL=1